MDARLPASPLLTALSLRAKSSVGSSLTVPAARPTQQSDCHFSAQPFVTGAHALDAPVLPPDIVDMEGVAEGVACAC